MIKWLAYACFIGSLATFGMGTLGLYRFPDAYSRIHAVGLGDAMGVGLMGFGLFLLTPNWILRLKLIIIIFLFWIINPTMTHMVAKAAVIHGVQPAKKTKMREG